MKLGKDIPVKYKLYDKEVKYTIDNGEMILYSNKIGEFVFTGLAFTFSDKVTIVCSHNKKIVEHRVGRGDYYNEEKGFLYINFNSKKCKVSFTAKDGSKYYARFLKISEE